MELFRFMTLSASLLILTALLLRPLTGRIFPRRVQMLLWIAAALRLLIPVRIASPLSFFALFSVQTAALNSVSTPLPMQDIPVQNFTPDASVQTAPPVTVHATDVNTFGVSEILMWVWLFGAFLMGAVLISLHIRELHRCRQKVRDQRLENSVPVFVRIYRCAAVSAPFTYGILRPKIILPEFLPDEDLPAVLAHELSHISALDLVKKHLFAAALCVNWFNPLVWIMIKCAAQDLEILCDARALRRPDAPDTKTYANALLNAEERRTLFTLGFTSNTEVRIMKILKKEKHSRIILVLSVLLVIMLVTGCITVPTDKDNSAPKEDVSSSADPASAPTAKPEKAEPSAPEVTAVSEPNFFKNEDIGWGDLRIDMTWEEAKPIIAELSGIDDPTLTVPEVGKISYIDFAASVFGYDGTVDVEFLEDTIQRIGCTFPLNGDTAVETALNTMSEQLCELLGTPDSPHSDLFECWSTDTAALLLYPMPMGETENEKHAVQIQVCGNSEEEYVSNPETEILLETETNIVSGEDEYAAEFESEISTEIIPTAEETLASTIDSTMQQHYKMLLNERKAVEEQIKELQKTLEIIDNHCELYDTAIKNSTVDSSENSPK